MTAADRLPSTPAEALQWVADLIENLPGKAQHVATAAQVRRWADELDAASATNPAPERVTALTAGERKAQTAEAFASPQVGDEFHEMYSFWVVVVAVEPQGRIAVLRTPGGRSLPRDGELAVYGNHDAYRRAFSYESMSGRYWVQLSRRGLNVEGWFPGWPVQAVAALEPAPEPDSAPGWEAASVEAARLTAERDKALRLVAQRDRELAEVTADRNRLREHSVTLNTIAWKIATALGDVPDGAEQIRGNPVEQTERLMAEVARLRDHADGLAEAGDTLIQQRDIVRAALSAATRERDAARAELATAQRSAPDWRERYVTARRDAAADTLEWAAAEGTGLSERQRSDLREVAAEVRAGTRTIPESTVPPAGTEADRDG